jgi:hypothetical protein
MNASTLSFRAATIFALAEARRDPAARSAQASSRAGSAAFETFRQGCATKRFYLTNADPVSARGRKELRPKLGEISKSVAERRCHAGSGIVVR